MQRLSVRIPSLRRLCLLLLLPLLAAGLTGCLEFEQKILLMNDGSGEITLTYGIEESQMPNAAAFQSTLERWQGVTPAKDANRLYWMFNEEEAKRFFTGDGIKMENYASFIRKECKTVSILCVVKDLRQALATGKFGDFSIQPDGKGNFILAAGAGATPAPASTPAPATAPPPAPAPKPAATTPEADARLKALCKGLRLKLIVQLPTEIVTTTGTTAESKRAEWVFDADKDSSFLRQTPALSVTFQGAGIHWPDTRAPAPEN